MSSQKILTLDEANNVTVPIVGLTGKRVAGETHAFTLATHTNEPLGTGATPAEAIVDALARVKSATQKLEQRARMSEAAFTVLQTHLLIVNAKCEMLEARTLRGRLRRLAAWFTFVADEVDPPTPEAKSAVSPTQSTETTSR